jgi:GntR family transcriptional regulator/MocR family aminotransferase
VDFDTGGDADLRDAVRQHVRTTRGIDCDSDQIIITTGSQQGVEIIAQIALEPGDRVAIEDPSFVIIQNVLRVHGAVLSPVPLDAEGLRIDLFADGPPRGGRPKLVYTTPTHQLPTGVTLSPSRRRQLIDWAVSRRALVIEDDGDADLSYDSSPPEAMFTMDDHGAVVYLGNFTRVLNPSIQISYMIVPPALADAVSKAHRLIARQTDIINQAALAKFISSGSFARHLRRLRRVHTARRDRLIRSLRDCFGDHVEIGPHGYGLHVWARWPACELDDEVVSRVRAAGVSMMLVRPMCIAPIDRDPGVVLAYASLTEQEIEEGVRALSTSLALR